MQRFSGKLIAGLIGLLTLGPVGLLFGLAIGHAFDRGLWQALQASSPDALRLMQQQFFDTTFTLAGYIAKADGRVSAAEVAQAENLFRQLRLSPTQRQVAIQRFKEGSQDNFDPATTVAAFAAKVGPRRQLQQTLFAFLASMALADGVLQPSEREALHRVAALLGMPAAQVDQLVNMLAAQARFHSTGGRSSAGAGMGPRRDELADAYTALGVKSSASDGELKKAYRKLMSENHQEISAAYDVVRDARSLS